MSTKWKAATEPNRKTQMARPSTHSALLGHLLAYLCVKDAEWVHSGRTSASLPATKEGKINVRRLIAEFRDWAAAREISVPGSAWQYVYEHPEWTREIDAVAVAQGLRPIKSREPSRSNEDAIKARVTRQSGEVKSQSEGHVQAMARIAYLERELLKKAAENQRLHERFRLMQQTGTILRAGDQET
jgi:hypothetical protein